MGIADYILIFIGLLILGDLILMRLFCGIMKKRDEKKRPNMENSESKATMIHNEVRHKSSLLKKVVDYILEHYIYGLMRYSILCCGQIPSGRIRKFLYKNIFLMRITHNTVINGGCEFRSPWNISADRCVIMSGCIFDGRSTISIGQDVVFGTGVHIWTEEHDVNDPYFAVNPLNRGPVVIESHAWVCSDSTILPRITIQEGAVVASRAVVTKDCEKYGIYGGVPAKKISVRNSNLLYELSGKPHWHFY